MKALVRSSRAIARAAVVVGATLGAGSGLAACSSGGPSYAAICINKTTHDRVPVDQCGAQPSTRTANTDAAFLWWYLVYSSSLRPLPSYGSYVSGGTSTVSPGSSYAVNGNSDEEDDTFDSSNDGETGDTDGGDSGDGDSGDSGGDDSGGDDGGGDDSGGDGDSGGGDDGSDGGGGDD